MHTSDFISLSDVMQYHSTDIFSHTYLAIPWTVIF